MKPEKPDANNVTGKKLLVLKEILQKNAPILIAYSGGVDSSLLAALALEYAGTDAVMCVLIDGPAFSRKAFNEAVRIAEELSLPLEIVREELLSGDEMKTNSFDRCRICKRSFYSVLSAKARQYNYNSIADGANTSDFAEFRPGIDEMSKYGVIHPFIMAGITKQDIRTISQDKGFTFWNKPSSACLYSRIPYGEEITKKKLRMVEEGEEILADMGILQYRVRHHGFVARIEVLPSDMELIFSQKKMILQKFQKIGFLYITLDLQGYRPGSMDEILPFQQG